ncbi:MAG: hypothetical protein IKK06_03005 [Clostridia bacterium]|nr:hypothetical protein [Clostridia bacterium]
MAYNFYYDESEHSRSIGFKTVTAENFYDNFITVIVGWKAENEQRIQEQYCEFEQKYIDRHPKGELKSDTIQNKQLRCGFASTKKGNINFIEDYFGLFSDDVFVYLSTFSKVEYIVNQLFKDYKSSLMFDMDMMKYSIIKSLVIYKPRELVDAIYNDPQNIVSTLKDFFKDRIKKNKENSSLKQRETESFEQILLFLDDVQPIACVDWDYTPPFVGFRCYLDENSIDDYSLTIDREGEHQKTVLAARKAGLNNVGDEESDHQFGIRMADMMAGTLGKLMKALCKAIHPSSPDIVQKTVLSSDWFDVSESQLALYKKLHHIVCELNNSWYKSFAGVYADDLVCLNALLNFMNHFENTEQIRADIKMQGEYYNTCACQALEQDYQRKQIKLPIDPIPASHLKEDYYLNQRGAKVYYDIRKQPLLPIPGVSIKYMVLSVGFDKNRVPLITIKENGKSVCYKLPAQLLEWSVTMVAMANGGMSLLPSEVIFTNKDNHYYADIL